MLLGDLASQMFFLILENPQFASRNLQYVCDYRQGSTFCPLSKRRNFLIVTQRQRVKSKHFFHRASLLIVRPELCPAAVWEKGGGPGWVGSSEWEAKQINIVCGRWWRKRRGKSERDGWGLHAWQAQSHTQYQITPRGPRGPHWQRCVPLCLTERKTSLGSLACLGAPDPPGVAALVSFSLSFKCKWSSHYSVCGQRRRSFEEQVTFSLMGREATKEDFQSSVVFESCFLIWVHTCAWGVFSAAVSEERLLFPASFHARLASCFNVRRWMVNVRAFVTQRVTREWRFMSCRHMWEREDRRDVRCGGGWAQSKDSKRERGRERAVVVLFHIKCRMLSLPFYLQSPSGSCKCSLRIWCHAPLL